MPTLDLQVAATGNDGFYDTGASFSTAVASCRMGKSASLYQSSFFRFTGVTIPAGSTITACYLTLYAGTSQTSTANLVIGFEDADNPAAPTSRTDALGRALTTATTSWTPGAWSSSTWYNTPSLVDSLQELVNTFAIDNDAVTVFVRDVANTSTGERLVRDYTAGSTIAAKLHIEYTASNAAPTITPNTADASNFADTTPTLEFTGSDAESNDLRYQVQISDSPDFLADGIQITDSEVGSGTGTLIIHPNPDTSATTWEGHIQVDDRPGQVFRGSGGILDKIEFSFGAHESTPTDTNGHYLARIYAIEGIRGDNVPVWSASATKTVGQMVRNTSGANANQQFLYVCTTGGTTGGTEPTWTEVENATFNDGTVVWEAHRGAGPLDYAAPADTPTPGWIAQSEITAYNPGAADPGWKACSFTGADRIRLTNGTWYCAILDWRPANRLSNNTITVEVRIGATHGGNCYIDGDETTNNGPRVGEDTKFRLYEDHILLDKTSGTDAGFVNTVTGGDTDPFNAGEKVSYTVQAGDALAAATYYWRARVTDPTGSTQWSAWATTRSFTVTEAVSLVPADATHAHAAGNVALTQAHTLVVAGAAHAHAVDSVAPTQVHNLVSANASQAHTVGAVSLIVATELVVANVAHSQLVDGVALTQVHNLLGADATDAHTADSVALTQVHSLAGANATHAHTVDSVNLTQVHGVFAAGILHAHAADAPALTQVHLLTPANAGHAHVVDPVTLGVAGSLGVANVSHAHAIDGVALVQAHTLVLASAAHAHAVDSVDLAQVHNVLAAGVLHSHTASNVVLELADSLAVSNAVHGHTASSLALAQVHYLAVSDGQSSHRATTINFSGDQPQSGALMPIAGFLGRQFAGAPVSNLHGGRFAAAIWSGMQQTTLAQAPVSGAEGIQFALAAESSSTGKRIAGHARSGVDAAPIINSPVAGQQGRAAGSWDPPPLEPM